MPNDSLCWVVWPSGHPDLYRCINCITATDAVHKFLEKYATFGEYEVTASASGDSAIHTFKIVKTVTHLKTTAS